MLQFSISVFLVIFVFCVNCNKENNGNEIATRIITENGTTYDCSDQIDVMLIEGENITVVMTHTNYINHALVTLPLEDSQRHITDGGELRKTEKFHITPQSQGTWNFSTLTNKDASGVNNSNSKLTRTMYQGHYYYKYQCALCFKVQKKQENSMEGDKTWMYLTGGGVLALIIVIQTFVILYILKTRKIRRIEQLALSSNTRSASDTARYSTTPRRPSLKTKSDEDDGSIYEMLDAIKTSANDAPPPPPIETLPRPRKQDKVPLIPDNNQTSTLAKKPAASKEERIRNRPPMPLPGNTENATQSFQPPQNETVKHPRTESNISVTMRAPTKLKMPAIRPAQIHPSPGRAAPEMTWKPSSVNQDPLSNELNKILKKRQTGTIPPKLSKDVPEPIPDMKPKPVPIPQGLRPPTMAKPTTLVTPAKLQRPIPPPKNVLVLPKSSTQQPPLAPKPSPVRKWPPVNPSESHPHPNQLSTHDQRPATPESQKPQKLPPRPVPVLPAEEDPDYGEYAEYADDDDEEWTYEPLTQYNIYSS